MALVNLFKKQPRKAENFFLFFLFFFSFLIFLLLSSPCFSASINNWNTPTLIKEWELSSSKEGVKGQILSITANKNGVFVLVKTEETRNYIPKRFIKKASKMTDDERRDFLIKYVYGHIFSGMAVTNMTIAEQNELIDFCLKYVSDPWNLDNLSTKEKENLLDFLTKLKNKEPGDNQQAFRKNLARMGMDGYLKFVQKYIDESFKSIFSIYSIQHYDFEGNLVKKWFDDNKLKLSDDVKKKSKYIRVSVHDEDTDSFKIIDSRDVLLKPEYIGSEGETIYLVDYDGNKIIKFDSEGSVLDIWRIERRDKAVFTELDGFKGMSIANGRIYLMTEGFDMDSVPKVFVFTTNGKLLKEKILPAPKVQGYFELILTGKTVPFKRYKGKVNNIAVDKEYRMYELAGFYKWFSTKLYIYDKDFTQVKSFEPVLKKGFDTDIEVFDPETNKKENYKNYLLGITDIGFDSSKGNPALEQEFYQLDNIYITPESYVMLTFRGQKPFGAINAIIYDKNGKEKGFWKVDAKSSSEWFKELTEIEKLKSKETASTVAFFDKHVFVGKTIEYRKGDALKADRGDTAVRSIIQRFDSPLTPSP